MTGYYWGMPRYPRPVAEVDYWQRTFDWSQLRRLSLHKASEYMYNSLPLAEFLAPQLVALGEIEFGDTGFQNDTQVISNFFSLLPSRKLLSISVPFFIPSWTDIAAHAATLHSLSIYPSPLTHQQILVIRNALPNLSALTVICDRDDATESWPYESFSLLASIPRLQHLTIWFEIGPHTAPLKPYLTVESAGDIFSQLRGYGAAKLQRLHLHSGFPPAPFWGKPDLDLYDWRYINPTSFVCKSKQDINGNSTCLVTCTKLSKAENDRLRRDAARSQGTRCSSPNKWDASNVKYQVALNGPMSLSEWVAWRDRIRGEARKGSTWWCM
ncbi:hypothetical protein V8F06_005418 [Rhypophila decipiens]